MTEPTQSRVDDRVRVNLVEPKKLAYWTATLRVSEEELRRLVAEVGPVADDLRFALGQR
jgi:hypothetical protein